eukprot:6185457-Heterocapsa_arctica.AAC.1
MIFPELTQKGLLIVGIPGIGKTPFAKIVAMCLGRYWVTQKDLKNKFAGWRRGKQMDLFRVKPGEIQTMAMLDDSNLGSISIEDLKAFLEVSESGSGDARYSPAKFAKNEPRAVLTNECDLSGEPDTFRNSITSEEFFAMITKTFLGVPRIHVMALLKRCVTIIAGHKALYLRLPSEHEDQKIHRFEEDDVARDWLTDENKAYLGKYKDGLMETGTGFEAAVAQEQALVRSWLHPKAREETEADRATAKEQRWRAEWLESIKPAKKMKLEHVEKEPAAKKPTKDKAATVKQEPQMKQEPKME